jgi:hypothetical protein
MFSLSPEFWFWTLMSQYVQYLYDFFYIHIYTVYKKSIEVMLIYAYFRMYLHIFLTWTLCHFTLTQEAIRVYVTSGKRVTNRLMLHDIHYACSNISLDTATWRSNSPRCQKGDSNECSSKQLGHYCQQAFSGTLSVRSLRQLPQTLSTPVPSDRH